MASRKLAAESGGLALALGAGEPLAGHALRPAGRLAVRPGAGSAGSAGSAVADPLSGLMLSRPAMHRTSLSGSTLGRTTVSRATTRG